MKTDETSLVSLELPEGYTSELLTRKAAAYKRGIDGWMWLWNATVDITRKFYEDRLADQHCPFTQREFSVETAALIVNCHIIDYDPKMEAYGDCQVNCVSFFILSDFLPLPCI